MDESIHTLSEVTTSLTTIINKLLEYEDAGRSNKLSDSDLGILKELVQYILGKMQRVTITIADEEEEEEEEEMDTGPARGLSRSSKTTTGSRPKRPPPSSKATRAKRPAPTDRDDTERVPTRVRLPRGQMRIYSQSGHHIHTACERGICAYVVRISSSKRYQLIREDAARAEAFCWWIASWNWPRFRLDHLETLMTDKPALPEGSEHQVVHLMDILQLPNVCSNMVQHYVGRCLQALIIEEDSQQNDIVTALCNVAENMKVNTYETNRDQCCCADCQKAKLWEENENHTGNRPSSCTDTQIRTKLMERRYTNLTPTYLRQCIAFSKSIPPHSPLVSSPEPPTDIRMLAPNLPEEVNNIITTQKLPLATSLSGIYPVYEACNPMTCVHYTDGDGGILIAELIPGLLEYAKSHKILVQEDNLLEYTYIPFREKFHDAPELGHCYKADAQRISDNNVEEISEPYGRAETHGSELR